MFHACNSIALSLLQNHDKKMAVRVTKVTALQHYQKVCLGAWRDKSGLTCVRVRRCRMAAYQSHHI